MHDHGTDRGATLAASRPVLDIYYRALSGRFAHLLGRVADDDPAQAPDTVSTIRLPNRVEQFQDQRANFDWYKVALTHRAAHYERNSFGFRFDRPSHVHPRLTDGVAELAPLEPETDLERVLRAFTYRSLAIDLFTIAEDMRIDTLLPHTYPGIARVLNRVQDAELVSRPQPAELPPRTSLLELFVRLSLGAWTLPSLPGPLHDPALRLRSAALVLREPWATVEDAVEVAVRAYALITRLPPLAADYGDPTPVQDGSLATPPENWRIRLPEPDPVRLEGGAILEATVAEVGYRDLLGWRYGRYQIPGPPGQEAIFRVRTLPGPGDTPGDDEPEGDAEQSSRPQGPPEPLPHEHHEWFVDRYEHAHGALSVDAPGEYLYAEWDHVQRGYRPRWCRVKERSLLPGPSTRLYDETVRAYRDVLPKIVRQLGRLRPEGLRLVGRQPDGDEIDLDAGVEALVDLRAGVSATDNVHQRLEQVARDVAVTFLLDLSSSTAERVTSTADEPRRFERIHNRPYRRVIDLERESVALLLAALRRTGDAVGLYGFSGTGRGDVRFDVVKDLDEPMSRGVASRIESLRPIHTTRMGAAVRHTTAKLRTWRASTKLLVLVSDGRPFDRDYGQEYGEGAELDYAVNDTRMALEEARGHRIRTFVLTVDTGGQDYLRYLGGELDTEVLSEVSLLPVHLLSLYKRLSAPV